MSATPKRPGSTSDGLALPEGLIEQFETAWLSGQRPTIEAFLADAGPQRRALLVELVHAELECRLKAGEPARVEEYLRRYPELANEPRAVATLIQAEYAQRGRRELDLGPAEYLQRFPQYRDQLPAQLQEPSQPRSPASPDGHGRSQGQPPQAPPAPAPGHDILATPPRRTSMIAVTCPRCRKKLHAKATLAGKRAKCPHCGQLVPIPAPAAAPADPELYAFLTPPQAPGELGRLGPYRVLKVLGAGGMGVVFQVEDPQLERCVALKAMKPSLAASGAARQRFLREAKATAAIKHDHIVTIFQVGEDRGAPFLAMEFLEGEPLDERLKREKKLPVSEALRIGREIAEGLAAAHSRGLIHRDIKPGNVWLEGERGRVKILDFGLARAAGDETHLTQSGAIVGTPAFMAPEQARSETVDARCDLFSLGAVLYRMLTGALPFKGHDTMSLLMALATDTPRPVRELNRDVPPGLADLVLQLLAKDPGQRPVSARAVADALAVLQEDRTQMLSVGSRAVPAPAVRKQRPRWLFPMAAAVLLLAGILVLGALITLRTKHGTLVVNVTEPDVQVLVDGEEKVVVDSKKVGRVELIPGEHQLTVKRGAEELYTESFSLKSGGEVIIDARWMPKPRPHPAAVNQAATLPPRYKSRLGMEFVLVRRGKFFMGGGAGKLGDKEVEIPHDFYLSVYEVTQEQWQAVTGRNPSYFSRRGAGQDSVKDIPDQELNRFPVESVTWDDAQVFLKELNRQEPDAGWVYRLPTEAEWEYACRGGPSSKPMDYSYDFYLEEPTNQLLPAQANYGHNLDRPCRVGSYRPSRLGLYDMHGNVWEWCDDPVVAENGASLRAARGGGCYNQAAGGRAAARYTVEPSKKVSSLGLRVARIAVGK